MGPGTQFSSPQKMVEGELLDIGGPLTYDECHWVDARVMQIDGDRIVTIAVGAGEPDPSPPPDADDPAAKWWRISLGKPTIDSQPTVERAFTSGPATASGWAIVKDNTQVKVVAWSNEVVLEEEK